MGLGNWALIDIETTGIDASYDQIIDIGFLQFEETKIVKTYSSLIRTDREISHFIQKLTGIKPAALKNAPLWSEVEFELGELEGNKLLAHNAEFERKFLGKYFEDSEEDTEFHDSIYFLGFLFPKRSGLNLESFILDFGLRDHEVHRGYEDSIDLLKVVLSASYLQFKNKLYGDQALYIKQLITRYKLEELWYFKLFKCTQEELEEIAEQIEFDLNEACDHFLNLQREETPFEIDSSKSFSYDFNAQNIKAILQDEEKIKEKIKFYRHRDSQEALSLKVGQSFKNNVHSMVQAPTGTGKTLGYLLPSTLFSLENDKQVLVATGTKTLQNQALEKDLPQLRNLLGLDQSDLKVERLFGSKNHLCEMLFRRDASEGLVLDMESFEERFSQAFFENVFYLNDIQDLNITRDDLAFILKKKLKPLADQEKEIGVDFRACTGRRCPFKSGCTYLQGLMKAKEADIILGNHALMFSWPKGFPRPSHIIVDEAHKIEEEASNAFTFEFFENDMKNFLKSLNNMQGIGALFFLLSQNEEGDEVTELITTLRQKAKDHAQTINDQIDLFHENVEKFFKGRPRYTSLYWNEGSMPSEDSQDDLSIILVNNVKSFHFIFQDLHKTLLPYAERFEPSEMKDESHLSAFTKFESFFSMVDEYAQGLEHFLNPGTAYVSSLKFHEEYGFSLFSAPIDIGQIVHDQLLNISESVVFTSATLANSKGDLGSRGMEWPLGYLYLEPERRFKTGFYLPPVYDYEENAKVFLCDDTPNLYDKNFVPKIMEEVIPLIREINGRSLLLFSARVRFEIARELLLEKLGQEIPLFVQGMGNNVIEDYKKSSTGVLLGMEAFSEGIDIPGESLQFVFIDKIPDMRQDLIQQKRRDYYEQSFGNEFVDYFMAKRARGLHQKLGRLLRRESDYGGVIVVDSRIKRWKSRTMNQFFQLMEPYKIERQPLKDACVEIASFIQR